LPTRAILGKNLEESPINSVMLLITTKSVSLTQITLENTVVIVICGYLICYCFRMKFSVKLRKAHKSYLKGWSVEQNISGLGDVCGVKWVVVGDVLQVVVFQGHHQSDQGLGGDHKCLEKVTLLQIWAVISHFIKTLVLPRRHW
jgi:amino acid transporter